MEMYKCPKCETEFSLGTKFCVKCGYNLAEEFIETPTCPVCEKVFPTGTMFCSEHGAKLVSPEQLIPRCGKCGKQYTDGTKFCPDCGESVRVFLPNKNTSASNFTQTTPQNFSSFLENLSSKYSISVGVIAGIFGVILFSLFSWINISFGRGYGIKANLYNFAQELNRSDLRYFFGGSEEFTIIRIVSVILVIAMIISFIVLIASQFIKSKKIQSTLAYSGFGLCGIVTTLFMVAMIIVSIKVEKFILTIFPFLSLAVAIATMIFAVKRPTKEDFLNVTKELKLAQSKPNPTTVLVLGIVSIIGALFFYGIIGVVTGMIGIVLSGTALELHKHSPDTYSESSHKNLKIGKICSIVGLSIGAIKFIVSIIYALIDYL